MQYLPGNTCIINETQYFKEYSYQIIEMCFNLFDNDPLDSEFVDKMTANFNSSQNIDDIYKLAIFTLLYFIMRSVIKNYYINKSKSVKYKTNASNMQDFLIHYIREKIHELIAKYVLTHNFNISMFNRSSKKVVEDNEKTGVNRFINNELSALSKTLSTLSNPEIFDIKSLIDKLDEKSNTQSVPFSISTSGGKKSKKSKKRSYKKKSKTRRKSK